MKRTYQTRIDVTDAQGDHLERYASLYGKCERTLFAETIVQSKAPESVKITYLRRFNITGRQFNAISRLLKGKVKSIKELRKEHLAALSISSHQAAALVIARRALDFSEQPNHRDYNASQLPAKDDCKHVWSYCRSKTTETCSFALVEN